MKRTVVSLLVLMVAAPAWAEVLITCSQVGDEPTFVSFVNTEPQHVRSFALDITADGKGKIIDVNCVSTDYYVCYMYPTAAEFDDTGEVTSWGLRDASGEGTSSVTVEMVWLYDPNDPDHNTPPADQGDLLSITLDEDYCTSVETDPNELLGGVVMEDGNSIAATCTSCWVGPVYCLHCDADYFPLWIILGEPECWCPWYECHELGDTDGDCDVDTADVTNLLWGWYSYPIWPGVCGDTDYDGDVDTGDIINFLVGWNSGCGECTPVGP